MLSSCRAGVVQLLSESTIKLVTNVLGGKAKQEKERKGERERKRKGAVKTECCRKITQSEKEKL